MKLELVDQRAGDSTGDPELGRLWGQEASLLAPLRQVARSLGCESWRVNLVLVSDQAMADLNQRFRQKAGVTDVLSFPYLTPTGEGEPVLASGQKGAACDLWIAEPLPTPDSAQSLLVGEVVLALDFVVEECRREGRDLRTEFMLLVIHGCLHLLGWDHSEPGRQQRMREREGLLLEQLGLDHPLREGS